MRATSSFAAAVVLATGALWATMLTVPPQSTASVQPRINIQELTVKANPEGGHHDDAF
ncbi:hypothetical protein [Methylobacterium oxalidis]|uniref:Uncharacterized protein n=1 Tax=Methylobacterium oxalidis TaxID=944322 RepID=A0A512JD53_9HYPH|nr:hypothetical protein [Methylobacterium oxalidis]GEP07855.1 hypothetical protein MOX02_58930 [Methylobacterium oxalidis]GJE35145.1 hypothetical protein LDDCCGHA_5363 [Methylobacterium oxalidis]GLS64893.1 hypothetical protein GCM10007888_32740 [Methylobacterium oxalidis]